MAEQEKDMNEEVTEEAIKEETDEGCPGKTECSCEQDSGTEEEASAEETSEVTGEDEAPKEEKRERKLNWAKRAAKEPKESEEDKLKAALAEEKDKHIRLMAEFDNYRKRTEKEKDSMYDMGAKDIVEKILPVIDNFERGLAALNDEEKEGAFAQGMDKTYRQFTQILEGIGVKPIEAVGAEFNPELHSAVMHVDDEEAGENIIVEEFQKGYTYKDRLVRPSMVKVAN